MCFFAETPGVSDNTLLRLRGLAEVLRNVRVVRTLEVVVVVGIFAERLRARRRALGWS